MNKQSDLMKIVCSEPIKDRQPMLNQTEATKIYNIAEIYDNPEPHMTTRGIFRYVGIEMIT